MALDESRKDDEVFDDRGLTYVIEKSLYENVKPIRVDYVSSAMGAGFNIASSMATGASCGSSGGPAAADFSKAYKSSPSQEGVNGSTSMKRVVIFFIHQKAPS